MITLTYDYQTDYAALANKLGADVVDAVLVMMGDKPTTWQRLALYADGVGDSDTMEELAGRAIVLSSDELGHVIAALTAEQRRTEKLTATLAIEFHLSDNHRHELATELARQQKLLDRSEAVTAAIWDQLP